MLFFKQFGFFLNIFILFHYDHFFIPSRNYQFLFIVRSYLLTNISLFYFLHHSILHSFNRYIIFIESFYFISTLFYQITFFSILMLYTHHFLQFSSHYFTLIQYTLLKTVHLSFISHFSLQMYFDVLP